MPASTTNYSWNLPTVGGDEDSWGGYLNSNWTALDTLLGGTDATEFAILDGATVTTAELNLLDGVTWTLTGLNGLTATVTEINYVGGVTSDIQTQLDGKQAIDATLTALAGLATGANKIPYSTGTDTFGQLDFKDEDSMSSNSATAIPSQQSVKAYVDAATGSGSMTLLDTLATTSGGSVTSSGLSLSGYTTLKIIVDNVSFNATSGSNHLRMNFGAGSYIQVSGGLAAAGNGFNGVIEVHVSTGVMSASVNDATNTVFTGNYGDVSAETSITFDDNASLTFDAGQILIYGVK